MECDHIDGNGLNNQRKNLRVVTRQENARNQINRKKRTREVRAKRNNKLGVQGIHWSKRRKKFQAQIWANRNIHLGYFFCLEKAKRAYREAELKYFGEFARKQA
jgi:hypothetical protein